MIKIKAQADLSQWYQKDAPESAQDQILNCLLDQRQISEDFLSPSLKLIPDPFLLPQMRESLDLFYDHFINGQKIMLVGDYDVDGVTSTALLLRFFTIINLENKAWFIPNRLKHGYGLTDLSAAEIIKQAPDLVITLDNGITAANGVRLLKEAGIKVIITDHHEPVAGSVPDCIVVNPKLASSRFPDREVAGVGVAFLWVTALRSYLREKNFWAEQSPPDEPNLLEHLDLVALGTIADQVPLKGVNRIFAKFGLEQMNRCFHAPATKLWHHYVKAFGEKMKVTVFDSQLLAFRLAPLINATGRMGDPAPSLGFLCSPDHKQALLNLKDLQKTNNTRKSRQDKMLKKAKNLAERQGFDKGGLVLYDTTFHEGISGIVAHRILDETGLPVCVLTKNKEGIIKGSLRSKKESVLEALTQCSEHLLQFGGHRNAGGCALTEEQLPEFTTALQAAFLSSKTVTDIDMVADLEVTPEMLSYELITSLKKLEPFGKDNQQPLFMLRDLYLDEPQILAAKHLKWHLDDDLELIYWNGVGKVPSDMSNPTVAAHLSENNFQGSWRKQLILQGISFS
ncbi:MAG: single-stranded-DNA-specific exonuclease RecJ [SAR324 cluster bacterium]|nr:single-stranded-DNA-specific exonuclease RecJ [SAR324 cluster bacterium]